MPIAFYSQIVAVAFGKVRTAAGAKIAPGNTGARGTSGYGLRNASAFNQPPKHLR